MRPRIICDLDGTLFDSYDRKEPYENTLAGILELKAVADLSMVTAGNSEIQWGKIERGGLRPHFDPILVTPEKPQKRKVFKLFLPGEGIVEDSFNRKDIIVVGDRIDLEIAFGNELGFTTVRILQGPYQKLQPESALQKAHFEINTLSELIPLIAKARH